MTPETLADAHSADPFRPFTIRMADGLSAAVTRPQLLAFNARGQSAVFADEGGGFLLISLPSVVAIDFEAEPVSNGEAHLVDGKVYPPPMPYPGYPTDRLARQALNTVNRDSRGRVVPKTPGEEAMLKLSRDAAWAAYLAVPDDPDEVSDEDFFRAMDEGREFPLFKGLYKP